MLASLEAEPSRAEPSLQAWRPWRPWHEPGGQPSKHGRAFRPGGEQWSPTSQGGCCRAARTRCRSPARFATLHFAPLLATQASLQKGALPPYGRYASYPWVTRIRSAHSRSDLLMLSLEIGGRWISANARGPLRGSHACFVSVPSRGDGTPLNGLNKCSKLQWRPPAPKGHGPGGPGSPGGPLAARPGYERPGELAINSGLRPSSLQFPDLIKTQ